LTPGGTVSMTLLLSDMSGINSFYVYGPTPDNATPAWTEFLFDNGTGVGGQILPDRIEVTIVDGGLGDSDLTADGIITFNGAPADAIPQYTLDGQPDGFWFGEPSNNDLQ
jgi:hypothetical protein